MHPARRRRLTQLVMIFFGVAVAVALILLALKRNIDLYYTPAQLQQVVVSSAAHIRLGGMVVKGSVRRHKKTLLVRFTLTDFKKTQRVQYTGVLPSLFREGQGIIAEGCLKHSGLFIADRVLAKHDSTYRPPDIPNTVPSSTGNANDY